MCVYVSDFLKEKEALGCSASTLIFYRSCLDRFSVFLDLKKCEYSEFCAAVLFVMDTFGFYEFKIYF